MLESKERRKEITKLVLSGKTYGELAGELGVSRQRIQQLNRPDQKTYNLLKLRANNKCEGCGIELNKGHAHHISEDFFDGYHELHNLKYLCVACHRKADAKIIQCIKCGKHYTNATRKSKSFCSPECAHKYHYSVFVCCVCGEKFELLNYHYLLRIKRGKKSPPLCSRKCLAHYRGLGVLVRGT